MLQGRAALSGRAPINPTPRGFGAVYRENQTNHCPGCGRTHWLIGRISAECAFCSTALPLAEASQPNLEPPRIWSRGGKRKGEASARLSSNRRRRRADDDQGQ
jgi:hypothetical protein